MTNPNQPLTTTERLALAASADRMANEIDNNPNDELQGFQDELRNRARMLRAKATLTPGTRVTTPHGPGTVTEPPTLMASGWTVKVRLDTPITASGDVRYLVDEITPGAPLPKRTPGATLRPALPKRTPGTHTGIQDAIDHHHTTPEIRQALTALRPDQKHHIIRAVTTPTLRQSGRLLANPYVYVPLIGAGLVRTKRGRRYLTLLGRQVAVFLAGRR